MLTGSMPAEETGLSFTAFSVPSDLIRSTEIWLLAASTASRYRPSLLTWRAPWDPMPAPVPAPPAGNGEPGRAVRLPFACRSKAAMVLVPVVLSLT